jgi:CheY-like chemotaxis protein
MSTEDEFTTRVRFVLEHLYDPTPLLDSPFVETEDIATSSNPPATLRRTIPNAIRQLEPETEVPHDTPVWRYYEILLYRYVQQCSQLEMAQQLGISVRHLRREEKNAIQFLAHRLERHPLFATGEAKSSTTREQGQEEKTSSHADDQLAWLEHSSTGKSVDLAETVSTVLDLFRPMAIEFKVELKRDGCDDVIPLAVHPLALRQILLSLLSVSVQQCAEGHVSLSAKTIGFYVEIKVRGAKTGSRGKKINGDSANAEMIERLAEICGGRINIDYDAESFTATLLLPGVEQVPVLLIDDNVHTWHLLQRQVSETKYRLLCTRNLDDALAVSRKNLPRAIILDVMMPHVDGWELLGRLRHHPLTKDLPIIVCTILPDRDLALSLGANGFLHKPVDRRDLIRSLDHQIHLVAPESG